MLDKARGKINMIKLRVMLLLESDFNILNKLVFNVRLLPSLEYNQSISCEIIGGRRGHSAIHIALNKKLVLDMANQTK